MTLSTEYRDLRLACGLSVAEAAAYHGAPESYVTAWEAGPPVKAPLSSLHKGLVELRNLRRGISDWVRNGVETFPEMYAEMVAHHGRRPDACRLYQFTAEAYPKTRHADEGMPHGAHNRMIFETCELLPGGAGDRA